MKEIAQRHASGNLNLESIDPFSDFFSTQTILICVIRTSGEEEYRISYYGKSHILDCFSDVHWPSLVEERLYEAIEDYQMRKTLWKLKRIPSVANGETDIIALRLP